MTFLEFSFPQQVVPLRDGLGQTVLQFVCTHSPQQYAGGQPESVCCSQSVRCVIFRVVSTPWPNLQISSFAPQHIRQDYPQALRRLSALLVRLSCHSSSG